jgi:hypothetical protein
MDERNMEKEEQNGKRKGWGIDRISYLRTKCGKTMFPHERIF